VTDLTTLAGVERIGSGKVRELYAVDDRILLVATDRISAFDVILPTPIPDKGKVLTGLSAFWFAHLADVVPNHLLSTDPADFPPSLAAHRDALRGRAMLCRRAEVVPIECVARGYLAGSGWKEYRSTGEICGIALPPGLRESDELPEPIFTPATKAVEGHDENIPFGAVVDLVGPDLAEQLRATTMAVYERARDHARGRGIIVADTKLELGLVDGQLILVDEVCTPDSSRFWPADDYEPGRGQASFDKQIVRDWLEASDWDKTPPGPDLPAEIVERTRARYVAVYEMLTGQPFDEWGS
jgi:phosphoribosylaminoimidazole-succinocarboxamide synthase